MSTESTHTHRYMVASQRCKEAESIIHTESKQLQLLRKLVEEKTKEVLKPLTTLTLICLPAYFSPRCLRGTILL